MNRVIISDDEWEKELRPLLSQITKAHDDNTAFTESNQGLNIMVEMMIECYSAGRKKELPSYWINAYEIVKGRRDEAYKRFKRQRDEVETLEKKFGHLDALDMTELTGGSMQKFLKTKYKKKSK